MSFNFGNVNQNFLRDTPSYFGLPFFEISLDCLTFFEISLDLLQPFLIYCGYMICKGQTYDYDIDLGCA